MQNPFVWHDLMTTDVEGAKAFYKKEHTAKRDRAQKDPSCWCVSGWAGRNSWP